MHKVHAEIVLLPSYTNNQSKARLLNGSALSADKGSLVCPRCHEESKINDLLKEATKTDSPFVMPGTLNLPIKYLCPKCFEPLAESWNKN